jgi:hypothetical protein
MSGVSPVIISIGVLPFEWYDDDVVRCINSHPYDSIVLKSFWHVGCLHQSEPFLANFSDDSLCSIFFRLPWACDM